MPRFPQPGTVLLGKYRVVSLVGEGGMGAVIKANHLELDEAVAIKVLLPGMLDRKDIVQRFLREAKAAAKLKGEHVARVHDVGRLDGQFAGVPYIVMEFLTGADLNAIIKHHGAQDPGVAADLLLQACEAIAEAHSMGIIHRDIKASNFFISQPDDEAPHLKVLDFGIATAPQGTSELTDADAVIGTPAYMAPEQMRAARVADARSDIWSMGVVLYELLEGKRPFRSDVYSDLCLKVGMDPPEPMVQPAVPDALRAIVLKCLEKSVERRYQSVAELAYDLMPYATDFVIARAAVEQCARLLGRRATRSFDVARAPDDVTPAPSAPMRITPPSAQMAAMPEPTPSGPAPMGRRTGPITPPPPEPKHTPTSIQASKGQISPRMSTSFNVRVPRRVVPIALGFLVASALGIGAVMVLSRGSNGATGEQPAPAAPPVETPAPATAPADAAEAAKPIAAPVPAKPVPAKPAPVAAPEPPKPAVKPLHPARVPQRPVVRPVQNKPASDDDAFSHRQ